MKRDETSFEDKCNQLLQELRPSNEQLYNKYKLLLLNTHEERTAITIAVYYCIRRPFLFYHNNFDQNKHNPASRSFGFDLICKHSDEDRKGNYLLSAGLRTHVILAASNNDGECQILQKQNKQNFSYEKLPRNVKPQSLYSASVLFSTYDVINEKYYNSMFSFNQENNTCIKAVFYPDSQPISVSDYIMVKAKELLKKEKKYFSLPNNIIDDTQVEQGIAIPIR